MATTNAGLQQVGVQAVVLDAQQFATLSKQIEKQIEGMNQASAKLASEGSSNFEKFSSVGIKSLLALNAVIVGVFAAVQLLSGVNLIQAATSVDQSLAVVQSASQGTQEQLAALKGVVEDLTRTTIANFNDILEASAELARGGIDIQDQLGGALKSVIELSTAAAGELPFDKAARAIASASTIFKIAGEDTSRVANALTVAAQQSSASFNDIIRSFQQVAPIAPLLKISLEDVAAAVGVLGKAGLRGSDAGTSLKQMFIQLLTPTKKAAELMKQYQISLFDVDGAVRPLGDLLQDLGDKFGDGAVKAKKITEAQRDQALATIFGADAIRAAALIAINGTETFFQMRDAMLAGTYTAEQLAAIIQAPLGSQLKILQNNLQATAVDIGTGLLPVIRSLVVELIKAAQAAAPFAKAIGDALNFAFTGAGFDDLRDKLSDLFGSQIAASILAFASSVQAVIIEIGSSLTNLVTKIQSLSGSETGINTVSDAFYGMANAVRNVGAVVVVFFDLLANLVQLVATNEEAFNRLKIAILSIAVGTIVAAFVGLIGVLAALATTFSAILVPMLAIGVVGGLLTAVLANLGNSGVAAVDTIKESVDGLDETIADAGIEEALVTPFTNAALEIPGVLEAIEFGIIQDKLNKQAPVIEDALVTPFAQAGSRIAAILDEINITFTEGGSVADIVTDDDVQQLDSQLDEVVASTEKTGKAFDIFFAAIKDSVASFLKPFGDSFAAAGEVLGSFAAEVGVAIGIAIDQFKNMFNNIGIAISNTTKGILQFQIDTLESLKGVSSGFDALIDGLQSLLRAWATGWDAIVTIIVNAANAGITVINKLGEAAANLANALPGSAGNAMFNSLPQIGLPRALANVPTLIGNVGAAFDALGTKARTALDGITERSTALTQNLININIGSNDLGERLKKLFDAFERTKGSMDGFGGPGGAGKVKKGAKEAEEAIVGFIDALDKATRLQSFIDAFGDVGAKAIDALVEAIVSNVDKDGAKAAEALHKFKQLLRTELVPDFAELGHEADAVFAAALIERSPEAIDAAIEVIRRMAEAAKAQGALTVDTFQSAFNLGAIANQLGSTGSKLFKDLTKAIVEGGTEAVKAVGATAADMVSSFVKDLSPDQARDFTTRFMAAITAAIADGSPAALQKFQDFSRQLNFDQQIAKAQNTLDKAIAAAGKTFLEGQAEIARKAVETLNDLYDTKKAKDFAEAEKQSIKEIGDLQLEVLKSVQDHQRTARKQQQEDTRQQLEDDRAAADLKDKRDEELADAIKARRKRLQAALKGEAPTKDQQAQGRAIQGNATDPTEDEVKALQKKWDKEDARAAIVLQRRKDDLVETRKQQGADELFELDLRTQFEEQKKIIEKPFRDFEKAEKEAAFQKEVADVFKTSTQQLIALDAAKTKAIDNAREVFNDTMAKLTLERDLADSVFDGMLEDIRAIPAEIISWHEQLKGQGGEVTVTFAPTKSDKTPGPDVKGGLGDPVVTKTVATAVGGRNAAGGYGVIVGLSGHAEGGIVGGAFGRPVPIMAHGGEYVIGLSAIRRMEQANVPNRSSSVVNNVSYNVNSSYSQVQEHGNVMLDMQAMVALTR